MNARASYYHGNIDLILGPRPKVKQVRPDGVTVYESAAEVKVRTEHLRRGRDCRAAERILDGCEGFWARPSSSFRHGGAE